MGTLSLDGELIRLGGLELEVTASPDDTVSVAHANPPGGTHAVGHAPGWAHKQADCGLSGKSVEFRRRLTYRYIGWPNLAVRAGSGCPRKGFKKVRK